MVRKIRLLLSFAVVVLLVQPGLAQKPAPELAESPTPDFWGMVVRDPLYEWNTNPTYPGTVNQAFIETMMDNLAAAGVRWVRFEFHADWDGSAYGAINMAQADYFIAAAQARNIKVLALLGTDLLKGTRSQVSRFDGGTVSGEIPASNPDAPYCAPAPIGCGVNEYMHTYLTRSLSIAEYYAGRIDAYELFNEQNFYFALRDETGGTSRPQDEMNPLHVARVITKFYRILRSRADQTRVVMGGLHPMTSAESGRSDRQYLAAIYRSEPFQGFYTTPGNAGWPVDGIGYHPYPAEMVNLLNDNEFLYRAGPRMDQLIGVLRSFDANADFWITEVGTRGNPQSAADLERQADFMRRMVSILYARREHVATFFWFKYEDFPPASEAWGVVRIPYDASGSYDDNGTVELYKPAFWTYTSLAHNFRPQIYLPAIAK